MVTQKQTKTIDFSNVNSQDNQQFIQSSSPVGEKPKIFNRYTKADQLSETINKLPTNWSLTPIGDNKAPYRNSWQSEPKLNLTTIEAAINGEERISKKGNRFKFYALGAGLRTGDYSDGLIAIDFDGESSHRLWLAIRGAHPELETVSWTSGRPGRQQILLQIPDCYREFLKNFTKISITEYLGLKTNKKEQLEFRYNEMQSVLPPSYHPKTGEYKWINDPFTHEVALAPNWLCEFVINSFTKVERSKAERSQERLTRLAENRERFKQLTNWELEDLVLSALNHIDPDCDYQTWLQVGMALHSFDSGKLHEFDRWSSGGSKYKGSREIALKWRSFSGGSIGIGTLFHYAKDYGFEFPKREFKQWIDPSEPDPEAYREYIERENELQLIALYSDSFKCDEWLSSKIVKFNKYIQKISKGFDYKAPKTLEQTIRENSKACKHDVKYKYHLNDDSAPPIPNSENWEKLRIYRPLKIRFTKGSLRQLHYDLMAQGWKVVIDISRTGTGKTHNWGEIANDSGDRRYWLVNPQHSNPNTITWSEAVNLEPRHGQIEMLNGEAILIGNCSRSKLFEAAYKKNLNLYSAGKNPICQACSNYFNCHQEPGMFIHERKWAIASGQSLRCDINQLPLDYEYFNDVLLLDEFTAWYSGVKTVDVYLKDFDRTINDFERDNPKLSEQIRPVFRHLRELFDRQNLGYYGWDSAEVRDYLKPKLSEVEIDYKLLEDAIYFYEQKMLKVFAKRDTSDLKKEIKQATGKKKDFLSWVEKSIKSLDKYESLQAVEDLPTNWLYLLLLIVDSNENTTVRFTGKKFVFTTKNQDYDKVWNQAKQIVILDATAYLPHISKVLNKSVNQFAVIEQECAPIKNLTINIVNTKGTKSNQFSDTAIARCQHLIDTITSNKQKTGLITHKELKEHFLDHPRLALTGHWFKDNRGSNDFRSFNQLIAIGSPNQNIGAITDACYCLGLDFQDYYNHLKQAEVVQMVGRQRADLNPDQHHSVYYLNSDDHELTIAGLAKYGYQDINILDAATVTPLAGTNQQKRILEVLATGFALHQSGERVTQENIAKKLGFSTEGLRKAVNLKFSSIKKLITMLAGKFTPTEPIDDLRRTCLGWLKKLFSQPVEDNDLLLVAAALGIDDERQSSSAEQIMQYLEAMSLPPDKVFKILVHLIQSNTVFRPPPLEFSP